MSSTFRKTDFSRGDRVTLAHYTFGDATFIEYADERFSCPADHITFPGMRLAYVEMDRYGRQPVWESDLRATVSAVESARGEAIVFPELVRCGDGNIPL